jgi:23S rRNA pseudouridine1911/1915/1917 synthase
MILHFRINEDNIKVRDFLKKQGISNLLITHLKSSNGKLNVNDQQVLNFFNMKKGDLLEVALPDEELNETVVPLRHPFDIVYEDSYMLLVNKEPGVPCIPAYHHHHEALANYIAEYYYEKGIVANIHFVSRLDTPTSGLVLIAKNGYVHDLIRNSDIDKKYLLKVKGTLKVKEGIIEGGIIKDAAGGVKRTFTDEFVNSRTSYKVLSEENGESLIEATLHTGKTHQLRVHFSHLGYPIIGDALYGEGGERLLLHSYHLSFVHPVTHESLIFERFPADF